MFKAMKNLTIKLLGSCEQKYQENLYLINCFRIHSEISFKLKFVLKLKKLKKRFNTQMNYKALISVFLNSQRFNIKVK